MVRVGLAMLQGARYEHAEALRAASQQLGLEIEIVHLKMGKEVNSSIDCLVLPGGESTAMRKASESESLLESVFGWMKAHPRRPVLGTCAGAILLAQPHSNYEPFIRTGISRNAWGRQRDSFEALLEVDLEIPSAAEVDSIVDTRNQFNHQPLPVDVSHTDVEHHQFHGVFIRAPRFEQSTIECLPVAHLGDETVGVLDGSKLALTFHPELTGDYRFHRWLLHRATVER